MRLKFVWLWFLFFLIVSINEKLFGQEDKQHDLGVKIISPGVYFDYQLTNEIFINAELGNIFGYNYSMHEEDRHDRGDFHIHNIKIEPRFQITKLLYFGLQMKYAIPLKKNTESIALYSTLGIRKEWKRLFLNFHLAYGLYKEDYEQYYPYEKGFYYVASTGLGLGLKLHSFN